MKRRNRRQERKQQFLQEIERAQYALDNPWVLKYNFGHVELIRKYFKLKKCK